MAKHALATILAISVIAALFPARGEAAPRVSVRAVRAQAAALLSAWSCETTQADGTLSEETDTIEPMGRWLRGMARGASGPLYDYYVGYAHGHWVYIQVSPLQGTFFVGTSAGGLHGSLNGSRWNVVYPQGESAYSFSESPTQFTIDFIDLRQVCNKLATPPAPPPAPTLQCATRSTGSPASVESYVSIVPLGEHWWHGIGSDGPDGRRVVYAYDIFNAGLRRVAVAINGSTGDYVIATSYLAPTLDNTVWTVVYPTDERGFSFRDVSPNDALPQRFTLVFADGYQTCSPL
jgi:hypothetical protein